MKKSVLFVIAAVIAFCMTSCGEQVKKENLTDNLVMFSTTTPEKTKVCGVESLDGKVLIPAEYESISLFGNYILAEKGLDRYLYTLDGKKLIDEPVSMIFDNEKYISLYGNGTSYYIFKGSERVAGPYKNAGDHMNLLFAESDKAEVITDEGTTLVSGDKIIMLYSKADQKYYFVVINGNEAKAHDRDGSELFALNVKLLDKLPQHGWSCGENMKAVSTRNEIKAFKK